MAMATFSIIFLVAFVSLWVALAVYLRRKGVLR
jgi:hypothetical protein